MNALPDPRHGIPRRIRSKNETIFEGIHDIIGVQYHSLHATISGLSIKDAVGAENQVYFLKEENECSQLKPLAWDLEIDNQPASHAVAHSVNPAAILMALAHQEKPFFGIQFHPESICSNANARKVVSAWWTTV